MENLFEKLGDILRPSNENNFGIDKLKKKKQKSIELLDELSISITAEKYKYLVKWEYDEPENKFYSLYDRNNNKLIMINKLRRVKSYLNVRNINENEVFFNI